MVKLSPSTSKKNPKKTGKKKPLKKAKTKTQPNKNQPTKKIPNTAKEKYGYLQAVHTVEIIFLCKNSMRIRLNYLVEVSVTDFVAVVGLNRIKLWLPTKT